MGDVVSMDDLRRIKERTLAKLGRTDNIERVAKCRACDSKNFRIYYDERSEYPFLRCSGCGTTIGGEGDNWRIKWFQDGT